jgi:hypothetical protein
MAPKRKPTQGVFSFPRRTLIVIHQSKMAKCRVDKRRVLHLFRGLVYDAIAYTPDNQ